MSKFNPTVSAPTKITNLAGGQAYSQSPELELVSILLTSFVNDKYYEKSGDTIARIKELVAKVNKKFAAQAAVYARTVFGMRSITHVLASELARYISKETWAKDFYNAVIFRPDDISEIVAYHKAQNGKLTMQMKKGLGKAFGKFDKYALAKYRGENKGFKMVDVVNLIHPKPTEKNAEALTALTKGELKSFDTWETELTKAGQAAQSEDEKMDLKKDAWVKLVSEKKIGYFALLRNLRNLLEQAPEVIPQAIEILTDERAIKNPRNLVLPFRYLTAYEAIRQVAGTSGMQVVLTALNKAVDIATSNVPVFEGDTCVVVDVSGSMKGKCYEIASLFAAALVKSNKCDLVTFDNTARYVGVNTDDSTITLAKSIPYDGGGTDFHTIFKVLNKPYKRVIILSDMQGWAGGYTTPTKEFNDYKSRYNADPFIYSFDLNGYGSMQFPERNVFCLAGFSEKVLDTMKFLETDKQSLITEIKQIQF